MKKEKTKVYTYTRVSTAMQVDGYSLDAQKAKMKAYADYNDYEIDGVYEDAGKLPMAAARWKKCAAQGTSISWLSRTTTCWQKDCMSLLFRKKSGRRRR